MATRDTQRAAKRSTSKAPVSKPHARKAASKRKPAAKKAPRKKAARPRTPTPEAIARRIVRATQDPAKIAIEDLYAEDCTSLEPGQDEAAVGHEGRRTKAASWEQFQDSALAVWKPRNVFVKRSSICIEWHAALHTRDGRELEIDEVAVYEIKGGKIASERFYYDPSQLAPPPAAAKPPDLPPPQPHPEPTGPSVDPIDL